MPKGSRSQTGVFVADEFRDNLIIDRYDPEFLTMRGSKTAAMRSENSEDALTWNVFRSLAQVDPALWFPPLFRQAFGTDRPAPAAAGVRLWQKIQAPPSLRLYQGDEGESEIDVLIETENLVWFIEAKYRSDISVRTTNNADRDQIVRNIDVGSWFAGVREFFFSLLVLDAKTCPKGAAAVLKYSDSQKEMLSRLPHRSDGLANLRGLGLLEWCELATVLKICSEKAERDDERGFAKRAVEWLRTKKIEPR